MVGQLLALVIIVLAIGKEPWTLFHTFARFRRLIIWNLQLAAAPYIYKSY